MRGNRKELYLFLDNEKQAMICSLFKKITRKSVDGV